MILVWLIGLLLVGGLLSLFLGQWDKIQPRWITLFTLCAGLIVLLKLWVKHYRTTNMPSSYVWILDYRRDWIPSFGINFQLAIDGLSLVLLILTFLLGILAILCSWKDVKEKVGFFHFNLMWVLAGISGVFMAVDLFLFYFFWEMMLIPMYFLIGIWGSERRESAAYKFFLFTQASGLLMFLAILGLYFVHANATGTYTFNYFELLETNLPPSIAFWLMMGFMIAFMVKLPVVPFHTWLPDAHGEAPTAGSLILAGLLLKTGAYGMLRLVILLFSETSRELAPWFMLLGVLGVVYGAVMAFSQTDLKRLIAYTSVSHMGFVILGIFAFNQIAWLGVVMQLITHALSTGALFIMAGMLKERLHTRDISKMGGLWSVMPKMGSVGMVLAMASLGLPLLGSFIAEFLILLGAFKTNWILTSIASAGLIISAIYSLRIVQKVFLGPSPDVNLNDLSLRELIIMTILVLSIIWLGVYPQPVINMVKPATEHLQEDFQAKAMGYLDSSKTK